VYIEKEETSVIRVERLESELATASTPEQLNELHKQFVDFHGEVLLLVHWSILAYTATVKILKKHHKRTGLLVKAPQLGNLLSQPFCSTEVS
jgi:SPX domain protein involved in polyphosphate accumulation